MNCTDQPQKAGIKTFLYLGSNVESFEFFDPDWMDMEPQDEKCWYIPYQPLCNDAHDPNKAYRELIKELYGYIPY